MAVGRLLFAFIKASLESKNQIIISSSEITLAIKREDRLHSTISGNKYRKLKYNLIAAKEQQKTTLLTFGGGFSNHIAAVAAAGKENGFSTIGIIRGAELASHVNENPTLRFAKECGMRLEFVSRDEYRLKDEPAFIKTLHENLGDFYLLPEGGTNALAVKGCEEILSDIDKSFDYVCCAVGTGGTIAGIINSAGTSQKILGFPALKGDFLTEEIHKFARLEHWKLISDYHFGGYAKLNDELIIFLNKFYSETKIPLDPIYTGKMVFGVMELINKGYFPSGSKILMIHTGGLQGIEGMNMKLKNIKSTLIDYHD